MIDGRRVKALNREPASTGPVIYWASRDQRVRDNWALLFTFETAKKTEQPLAVAFCLVPRFLGATLRQYDFMLRGLREMDRKLAKYDIPFYLLHGDPTVRIPQLVKKVRAGAVVTDFSPLKIARKWKREVARTIAVPLIEVDAHNIVPCWIASQKQEYAARTLRPKIRHVLPEFLTPFPGLRKQKHGWNQSAPEIDWDEAYGRIDVDASVGPVQWIRPGEKAARAALRHFIEHRLDGYNTRRNIPGEDGQSELSPYLHFGHLSAQRVALEVSESGAPQEDRDTFLEELVVRRELSDNYCYYNPRYDSFQGAPRWAKQTLDQHVGDRREYVYSRSKLEGAQTHDELWNAAQREMVRRGKMHGYMRMYWAKKILEWTKTPERAFVRALYLNDRYELDGRDPSGYVGIAWSIAGVHDRPWFERSIFGKIRYMSYNGCARKFDISEYVKKVDAMSG